MKKEAGVVMKPGGRRYIQEEGGRNSDEAWREKVYSVSLSKDHCM